MRHRVIIADDEPLVLIGLEDLIDWGSEGFEIISKARNGKELSEQIAKSQPDLVITDIKMPIKSGIEVMEDERKKGSPLPLFILLTSFEEFELIKKAMSLEAVDYIIKLELEKEQLISALRKAKAKIEEIKGKSESQNEVDERQMLQERYLMRCLFSLDAHEAEAEDVGINLDYPYFVVSYITLPEILREEDKNKSVSLFYSATRLLKETVNRYTTCYVIQLDLGHIAAIFPFTEKTRSGYRSYIFSAFKTSKESLGDYFSLNATFAVGPIVNHFTLLSDSFYKARLLAARKEESNEEISFFDHSQNQEMRMKGIDLDGKMLSKAFSEMNADLLSEAFERLISSIREAGVTKVHAIDASGSVLYMAMNSINDFQEILEQIFPSSENIFSYRVIYQARNIDDVIAWLERLKNGLEKVFREQKLDYRLKTVQSVQAYIKNNITGNLDLGSVASIFGYSKNYLSSLFTKYAKVSFIDYVNNAKIERAKMMLSDPNAMVYEVATALGFDSPFYFSKVFKKITGTSPTAYQNSIKAGRKP